MGATTSLAVYGRLSVRFSRNTEGLPADCASVAFSFGSSTGSHGNLSQRCTMVRHASSSSTSQTSSFSSSCTTTTRSGGLGTSVVETKSEYRDSAGNVKSEHLRQIGNATSSFSSSCTTTTRSGGLGTSVVETKSEYRDSAGNVKSEHLRQIGNRSQVTRLEVHNGQREETTTTTGLAEGEDFERLWAGLPANLRAFIPTSNRFVPRGMPAAAIAEIPRFAVSFMNAELFMIACAICQEEYEAGHRVCTLPCHHVFHLHCVRPWLQRSNTCPLCRASAVAASPLV
eukprot:CAMPEP_0196667278 /NCGR_PEP_ID=MMETSP1086-20130531/64994_1 /TAXON_ID=77921 /ORGANISM="Cyanoptyche  gloeocystis , Strain SAG4.97" /LENGTH=284 /DNA_ID=CAMNT_0042004591 /DNA_START=61 /DNA_END=916 /DNA_ORIENTATION=-